jgi:hypothetical protein
MNMTGHDSNLAFAGRNNSGTVRPDQARWLIAQILFNFHHIERGNAFCDADHNRNSRVGRFHDRVRGKGRRHIDDGRIGACLFDCVCDRVEDRDVFV